MIKNFVKILELLGDRLEVCVSVYTPTFSFLSLYSIILADAQGGGGGGTLIFSSYIGLDPAFHVCQKKKYQEYQAPTKKMKFCTLTLRKDPEIHRNDP